MSKRPDAQRLLKLQELLLRFSQIDRVVDRKHAGEFRAENDTEHSYNLAVTAMFLAPHFSHLDVNKLIQFSLVHDMVEIYAGDTYAFADAATLESKAEREAAAQKKLSKEWSDFPLLNELVGSYEKRDSKEAAFIYALDKIMPIMQIFLNEGHTWKKENMTLGKLHVHKQAKLADSPEILEYYDQLFALLQSRPELIS